MVKELKQKIWGDGKYVSWQTTGTPFNYLI